MAEQGFDFLRPLAELEVWHWAGRRAGENARGACPQGFAQDQ